MKKQSKLMWMIVEKADHLAIYQLFGQCESTARRFLANTVPVYISKGYYSNKALKPEDFEVVYQ